MNQAHSDNYIAPPGSVLRDARLSAGKSVEQVAEALNLLTTHVEALECNDYSRFNSPMFARGYIRSYARHFGLDEAPLLKDSERICRRDEEQAQQRRPKGSTQAPIQARLSVAALVALIIWGVSYLLFGGEPKPRLDVSLMEERYVPLQELRSRSLLGESLLQVPSTASDAELSPELLSHPASVRLDAVQTVWLELRDADGTVQFRGQLEAGQSQSLDVKGPVQLALAYWPAVRIQYNQQDVALDGLAESNAIRVQIGEL